MSQTEEDAKKLASIRQLPKTDFHNHSMLGGRFQQLISRLGIKIERPPKDMKSLQEMDQYIIQSLAPHFSKQFFLSALECSFMQAKSDGVVYLQMSIDAGCLNFFSGSGADMIQAIKSTQMKTAPEISFLPQLGFQRTGDLDLYREALDKLASEDFFQSIDLYGQELLSPIKKFKDLFRKAEDYGLLKYCHVGEEGSSDDIGEALDTLSPDAIQHGIKAVQDKDLMKRLASEQIPLHVCPASNLALGMVSSIKSHPIKKLLDAGIRLTINTDDVLLFDQGVSEQMLALERSGCLSASEIEGIRQDSLALGLSLAKNKST